ncbi:MAG: hypothetical protein AB7P02_17890 [Alphaproteobacteria bacterium]
MRIVVVAAVVATMAPASAYCLDGNELAKQICVPGATGYPLSISEASTYNAGSISGYVTYNYSTYYRFYHSPTAGDTCQTDGSEGMGLTFCQSAPVIWQNDRLMNSNSWTPCK